MHPRATPIYMEDETHVYFTTFKQVHGCRCTSVVEAGSQTLSCANSKGVLERGTAVESGTKGPSVNTVILFHYFSSLSNLAEVVTKTLEATK